jgi:hypothetical protein
MAKKNSDHFKLDNADGVFIPLSIEILDDKRISLCHYGESNGDLMRDPEMIFWKSSDDQWFPIYFRNDWAGVEEFSCHEAGRQLIVDDIKQQNGQADFANIWLMNIKQQQEL